MPLWHTGNAKKKISNSITPIFTKCHGYKREVDNQPFLENSGKGNICSAVYKWVVGFQVKTIQETTVLRNVESWGEATT